jgi:hypothetical protein
MCDLFLFRESQCGGEVGQFTACARFRRICTQGMYKKCYCVVIVRGSGWVGDEINISYN